MRSPAGRPLGSNYRAAGGGRGETTPPRDAIARVPIVPAERRLPGNIVQALAALERFSRIFPGHRHDRYERARCDPNWRTDRTFRPRLSGKRPGHSDDDRLYTRGHQPCRPRKYFPAMSAKRPHASRCDMPGRLAVRYMLATASDAVFADRIESCGKGEEELVSQAIANGDEHVIKFTEACLNRYAQAASPAYLAAADHVARMIRPRPLR